MNRGAYEYQQQSGGRAQSSSPGVDDGQQQQRQLPPDAQYGQPGVNAQGPYRHSPPPHMAHDRSYSQANSFNRAQPQQQQSTYGAQARPQSQYIMGGQQPGRGGSPSSPGPHARPMSYADPQTSYGGPAAGPAPAGQPRDSAFYASPAASRSHLNSSPAPSSNQGSTRAQAPPGAPAANRQTGPPTRQGSVSSQSTSRHQHPPPPPRAPSTIGGEPLHDLGRAVALLKSSKFYAEGFLMKKVEVGPDGKAHPEANESQWAKWFVQLSGTILSTWNAADMEEAARQNRTVPPQYLNLSDAFLHPYPPPPNRPAPTQFQFALNSAGLNRVLFCAPTLQSLNMWINAIRLAVWERSRCNEIYTGTLLGQREPKPNGWPGFDAGLSSAASKGKFEGWLKIRLPGDTEWRRLWTTVLRGTGSSQQPEQTKKTKRTSLLSFGKKTETPTIEGMPGNGAFSTIGFYTDKPTKKDQQPMCIAQHIFYAAAIYPESEKLINRATLFKLEGTFLNPNDGYRSGWGVGGRAEKQGYALLMLEEGDYMGMLEWIVGLSDAFKLYGRPRGFSWDPRDPSSMYFALPIGPHRDRQFLDRELVDNLDINESRPRAIRAVFHNILFDRMRGVRPAALGPETRSAPLQSGASTASVAPQLAPMESSAPLKLAGDASRPGEQQNFAADYDNARTDSPSRRGLPAIGESSTLSHHESTNPAVGSSEQSQQDQRERMWQESQARSSAGHSNSPYAAEYHSVSDSNRRMSVMPLHETGSDNANEQLSTRAAFHSSDVSRSSSPPPAAAPTSTPAYRNGGPPELHPIVTSAPNGAPNFSRPTPQMLSSASPHGTDAREHLEAPQQHSETRDYGSEEPKLNANMPSETMLARDQGNTAQPKPLPSPGASSLAALTPDLAGRASPVTSLGYLNKSPVHTHEPRFESQTETAPPVPEVSAPNRGNGPSEEPMPTSPSSREPGVTGLSQAIPNTPPLFSSQGFAPQERAAHVPPSRELSSGTPATASTTAEAVADAPEQPIAAPTSGPATRTARQSDAGHSASDDYHIHSDLLAAINYVDRSSSPPVETPVIGTPSTTEPSPIAPGTSKFQFGPPKRGLFQPASPVLEQQGESPQLGGTEKLGDEPQYDEPQEAPRATPAAVTNAAPAPLPSSFAPNKRAEERLAAARLAEQAQQAALTKPGRHPGANKSKPKAWVDSDEDDEEERDDEDDSSEEAQPVNKRHSMAPPASTSQQDLSGRSSLQPGPRPMGSLSPNDPRRQSYLERGPSPENRLSSLPASPMHPPTSLPGSPSRPNLQLRGESPARVANASLAGPPPNLKPVVSPHGLLHAGIIDREERSARALEQQAREGGGPLVNLPQKPPPPQTGLVGAITSHEREKERTGGVGRALTEQQRERKQAELRQRQLDELQRQQLAQQQMQLQYQMQMAQMGGFGGMPGMGMGMGSMSGMGGMPWMMPPASGFGSFPSAMGSPPMAASQAGMQGSSPPNTSPMGAAAAGSPTGMLDASHFQQQQQQMFAAQQAAQAAAQAAYMQAMVSFSSPPSASPGGSPPLNASQFGSMSSFPSMNFSQAGYYPPVSGPMGFNAPFGGFNPYQPAGFGGPGGVAGGADIDDEGRAGHGRADSTNKIPPLSMPGGQHQSQPSSGKNSDSQQR